MDNVTHVLAGCLVADVTMASRRGVTPAERSPAVLRLACVVSAVAQNVPDADVLYASVTKGKLGYLLHHRGHTHTIVVGVLLGVVVAQAALAWARRRGVEVSPADGRRVLALGAFGPLMHIGMDGWNVYGIHPFWPFSDRWHFGDAVFIFEPLLWVLAAPSLFVAARSRLWRGLLGSVLALALALPWLLPAYVPTGLRLLLLAVGVGAGVLARLLPPSARAAGAIGAWGAVVAVFFAARGRAFHEVADALRDRFPGDPTADIILSPLPVNPLCWSALAVQTTASGDLVMRQAIVATAPSLLPTDGCPQPFGPGRAVVSRIGAPRTDAVQWEGEVRGSVERLRSLARGDCRVAAYLRFARAPFVIESEDALTLGDLRFDRGPKGFATVDVRRGDPCPELVPPWEPPRADVIEAAR